MRLSQRLLILLVFVSTFFSVYAAERLLQPYNLNFEDGVAGSLPKGWFMATKFYSRGFKAGINSKDAISGKNCLEFSFEAIQDTTAQDSSEILEDNYGFIYQSVDAKDYRSKKIRFRVALLTENLSDSSNCKLRLTAHFTKGKPSQNFLSDSIKLVKGWNYYEVIAEIDNDADMLNYGFLLSGFGYILADDASLEYINENSGFNISSNRMLNAQELENLTAYTKLLGNVRYFYPGFEVAELDWEKFALTGVEYVESSQDKTELVERLNRLFLPVAPGLQISVGKVPLSSMTKPQDAMKDIALSWVHVGANLGIPIKNFSNQLKNIYLPTRQREAPVIQIVDAMPFRGKKIRFSAYIKTDLYPLDGHVQLWLGADIPKEDLAVFNSTIDEAPIADTKWTKHSIEADVPSDATVVRLGLVMLGDGKVWFDNTSLQIISNGKESEKNYAKNPNFEDAGTNDLLISWTFPESAGKAGYSCKTTNTEKYDGKASLTIQSDEKTRVILPKLGEQIQSEIAPNVFATMPLTNYVDSTSTLPKPSEKYKPIAPYKPDDFVINSSDKFSRYAVVALLWNVYRHFAIGVDEKTNWDEILSKSLMDASTCKDKDFIDVLNRMLTKINDGQGRAWTNSSDVIYGLPFLWRWVGNDLVVYQNEDSLSGLPLGTIIKKINNKTIEEHLNKLNETNPGNTEQWKKLRAAAILRGGIQNEAVELQVITPDKQVKNITFTRNKNIFEIVEVRPPQFQIMNNDNYYFDLTRITDRGLKNIVNDLKDKLPKAKNIIFDLRGFCNTSEEFLGMFMSANIKSVKRKYPVYTKPGGKPCTFFELGSEVKPMNPLIKSNIYFLIDERTSGGAEIISAVAKRYKIGKLVGTTTSGTADEVLGINLPGEFNASIVAMIVELPDSKIDFKKGIEPDIKILPTIGSIGDGKDEILEYVYGLLNK